VESLEFPGDALSGFGLTDGVGVQAFVLVASAAPLRSFDKLQSELLTRRWGRYKSEVFWRYDGHHWSFDQALEHERGSTALEHERGSTRPLAELPVPLDETCRAFKAEPGIEAIHVIAFPVRNQKSPT
jgi:hypothetical protein